MRSSSSRPRPIPLVAPGPSPRATALDAGAPRVHESPAALAVEAAQLRREILEALHAAGGGHYGGSLSVIDVLLTLYRRQLRVSPSAPRHPERDRLILSKGHAAVALYAVLRRLGFFKEELATFASFGSPLEGHPDMMILPGVDFSTGSLGQGLSAGIGMALARRGRGQHVWVVLGDGECQEGQVWEAAMLAARLRLERLHVVIDSNRYQECGWNWPAAAGGTVPVSSLPEKWTAFGWRVLETDGHDFRALESAFSAVACASGQPSVVIAHTVKGKGLRLVEADPIRFHCTTVSEHEHEELMRSLPCA